MENLDRWKGLSRNAGKIQRLQNDLKEALTSCCDSIDGRTLLKVESDTARLYDSDLDDLCGMSGYSHDSPSFSNSIYERAPTRTLTHNLSLCLSR